MVTIATNMAGRGTDIVLGGNIEKQLDAVREDESLSDADKKQRVAAMKAEWQEVHNAVLASGGLHIIGSERHDSRRIDTQLRGRSGRQGDPGSSRFYLSMDDQLLRIFMPEGARRFIQNINMPEGEAIEARMVSRSIENAQRKVEARNFDIRKQLLEYDDVSNDQRKVIYSQRNELLEASDISETIRDMRHGVLTDVFRNHVPAESVEEQWDIVNLEQELSRDWQMEVPLGKMLEAEPTLTDEDLLERLLNQADEIYNAKVALVGREAFSGFERSLMLNNLDMHWREHLAALDYLRQGIHLRGYAQKNPKQEYKREAFELFSNLLDAVRNDVIRVIMTVRIQSAEQIEQAEAQMEKRAVDTDKLNYQHADANAPEGDGTAADEPHKGETFVRTSDKVGRNDPCPCGSGKKFKQCHGKLA